MDDCKQTADKVKAIAACTAVIKDAAKDKAKLAEAYSARAAALAAEKPRDALSDLSQALYAEPTNAALWTKRADVRSMLGQHFRAAVDYSVALKYAPNNVAALLGRGDQYRRLGVLPKAIEDADAVLKIDPKSAVAYANRAYAEQRYGQDDKAYKDAEEAIKLDPKSALAYAARGFAKLKTDKQGGLTDLKKALELDPKLEAVTEALKKLAS